MPSGGLGAELLEGDEPPPAPADAAAAAARCSGFPIIPFATHETIPMTIPPQNAAQKPATSNPFTKYPTNNNNNPFTIGINNPNVKSNNGSDKIKMTGRNTALNTPNNKDAVINAGNPP